MADEVIARLNAVIQDPSVRADVGTLLRTKVGCSRETLDHPTIQASASSTFGVLGLLNGVVGAVQGGRRDRWGYIAAVMDADHNLVRFERTDAGLHARGPS